MDKEKYYNNLARCKRKVYFKTRAKAKKVRKRWQVPGAFDVYHCKYCGGWHIGSRNKDIRLLLKRLSEPAAKQPDSL